MRDLPKHKGLRNQLVKIIKAKGIKNKKVLDAISKVPRHLFMDSGFIDFAYKDQAFPIAANQTISQPYTVAFQTELLEIEVGDKVLEIGTGSGYQTAVLITLKAEVYSVERQKELYEKAKKYLPKIGYVAKKLSFGDGYKGWPTYAPFDKILVTAGAPEVPKALLSQLKIGGRLVIPVGDDIQIMTVYIRTSEKEFEKHEYGEFRFVPMLKESEK
ncbi:MAG: protein-L-isoaspartate(D-aspartate) O-methyltransferase [Aureibaculum sp.]